MTGQLQKFARLYRDKGAVLVAAQLFAKIQRATLNRALAKRLRVRHVRIGPGAWISGFRHIQMGEYFSALEGLWLDAVEECNGFTYRPKLVIGDNVAVSRFVHIAAIERVEIGNDVLIGSNVLISDHNHGCYSGRQQSPPSLAPNRRLLAGGPVIIGDRVWLGDGVVVCPGVIIGEGSVVGANSVVSRSLPANSVAAGSPAIVIRTYSGEAAAWIRS